MKKVIDGKLYNTDTATLVADYEPFSNRSDFNWWCEELYVTNKGNWFIFGTGGPASQYSKSGGGSAWGSSDIRAIEPFHAYEWLESHNKIEAIEKHFPDEVEEA
jgi:hypothetical protein